MPNTESTSNVESTPNAESALNTESTPNAESISVAESTLNIESTSNAESTPNAEPAIKGQSSPHHIATVACATLALLSGAGATIGVVIEIASGSALNYGSSALAELVLSIAWIVASFVFGIKVLRKRVSPDFITKSWRSFLRRLAGVGATLSAEPAIETRPNPSPSRRHLVAIVFATLILLSGIGATFVVVSEIMSGMDLIYKASTLDDAELALSTAWIVASFVVGIEFLRKLVPLGSAAADTALDKSLTNE